jgi:Ner family transcriptional regulator
MTNLNTPKKNADMTADEVREALYQAGWPLYKLGALHGVNRSSLQVALYSPAPRSEARIAEALGVTPQEIWPSRYNADGKPNRKKGRPVRPPAFIPRVIPNLRGNHSTASRKDNVKAGRAA